MSGYAIDLIGVDGSTLQNGQKIVELERNSCYILKIANSNDHSCLVNITIDGVEIGKI